MKKTNIGDEIKTLAEKRNVKEREIIEVAIKMLGEKAGEENKPGINYRIEKQKDVKGKIFEQIKIEC